MNKLYLPLFDLRTSLLGGQSFGWDLVGDTFHGFTSDRFIKIRREGDYIFWQTYPVKDDYQFLAKYLRFDDGYEEILKRFPKDKYVDRARSNFPGLRLLSQDFEDTLLEYLCATNKSIKAIRVCIRKLRDLYGEEINVDGERVKLFPKFEDISISDIDTIAKSGAGFRSKYIFNASQLVRKGVFKNIEDLSYREAKELLKGLNGVGDKVADCILLYSLRHDHVIPLDVWVKRIMDQYYGVSQKMKYDDVQDWISSYFNGVGGWAGQMLFEDIRGFK